MCNKIATPLVSIITPMYNAEKFIGYTVDSVLGQDYPHWEMIVVDNCSTDGSREIVRQYMARDSRIRMIELPENSGGPAHPRNVGLDNANGDLVAFLDSDDVWRKDKLRLQCEVMHRQPTLDLVYSRANLIDEDNRPVGIMGLGKLGGWKQRLLTVSQLNLIQQCIPLSSILLKNRRTERFQFDDDTNLIALEDWKFLIALLKGEKLNYFKFETPLLDYRLVHNSLGNQKRANHNRKAVYMFKKLLREKSIGLSDYLLGVTVYKIREVLVGRR
jgi:teichuronic acid biosynthesis glycosyltransferase TuaG